MRGSVFKRGRTWTAQVYLGRDAVTGRKRYRQLGGFGTKRAAEQALTEQLERLRVGEYVDCRPDHRGGVRRAMADRCRAVASADDVRLVSQHARAPRGAASREGPAGEADGPRPVRALRRAPCVRVPEGQHDPRALAHHGEVHPSDRAEGACRRRPLGSAGPEPGGAGRPSPQERSGDGDLVGAQARRFIEAVADDRLRAMWVLLCSTGMRRGEVLGLRWDDLDLDAGRLAVQRALVEVSGYDLRLSDPKSARGRRSLRLDAHTTAELVRHRRRQLEERMADGVGSCPSSCSHDRTGASYSPNASAACSSRSPAGQSCRRSACTTSATRRRRSPRPPGSIPRWSPERLGHSTIQLTLRHLQPRRRGHPRGGCRAAGGGVVRRDRDVAVTGPSGSGRFRRRRYSPPEPEGRAANWRRARRQGVRTMLTSIMRPRISIRASGLETRGRSTGRPLSAIRDRTGRIPTIMV